MSTEGTVGGMNAPAKNGDLHGMVPDECSVALLLVDVINDLEFEGGEELLPHALNMAKHLCAFAERVREAGIPVIYVNDNFGRWRSDFKTLVRHATADGVRGAPVARMLTPHEDDYFVLKAKDSGFYATALPLLLAYLQVKTLILTGLTTNMCVLFTAYDAYMRDFHLFVPADCVAAIDPSEGQRALEIIHDTLKADIRASAELDLDAIRAASRAGQQPS